LLQGFSPQLTQPIRNQATWSMDERIVVCIAAHLKDIDIPENLKSELDQPDMRDKLYEYWEKLSFSPVARQALLRYLPQGAKQELANKLKTGEDFLDYFTLADDLATTFPLLWRECIGKEWPQENELLIPTQLAFSVALRCNEASWIQLMQQLLPNYAGMWLAVVQDPSRLAQATPTFLSCGPTSSPSSAWSLLIKENHPAFSAALNCIPQDKLEEALSHCSFDTPFFESLTEEQWAEIPEDRLLSLLMHWDRKSRHAFLHQNPHHKLTQRIYAIFARQCKSDTFAFDAFSDDLDTIKAAILHYASTPRAPLLTENQITSLTSVLTLPDEELGETLTALENPHPKNSNNLLATISPPPPPTFDWDAILKDPVTGEVITDPIIIDSGYTFNRAKIQPLIFLNKKKCPKTDEPFTARFNVNQALKNKTELCPLTQKFFDLPYYCVQNGFTYEYQAIVDYWNRHKKIPTDENSTTDSSCILIPNRALNTSNKPFPTGKITLKYKM
ncbi:MAG: hypothetical protein KDK65_03155, partial [Chlamydiia bacterium]|nr:hypothetical protein [Chlamydiia bacterium]